MTGRAFGAGFVQPVRNHSQATVKFLSTEDLERLWYKIRSDYGKEEER